MAFSLKFGPSALAELARLQADGSLAGRLKAVQKALGNLQRNPRHQSLNTHEYKGVQCEHGDKLWEAYAENNRPAAYRIFFCYAPPPPPQTLYIDDITQHP